MFGLFGVGHTIVTMDDYFLGLGASRRLRVQRLLTFMQWHDDAASAAEVTSYTGDINEGGAVVCLATFKCYVQTLAALAARGDVDPNQRGPYGSTALLNASSSLNAEPMKALLHAFPAVDLNISHPVLRWTALHYAALTRNVRH